MSDLFAMALLISRLATRHFDGEGVDRQAPIE
jgi:hypothetical protein